MSSQVRYALIIEDDPDASEILAELVREQGYTPIQTASGEEGLKSARRIKPDVVLLDLMLPDLDGYAICEALKLDRETNPIPVVMVTAMVASENRVRGFRVGADAYVTKPYTADEIFAAIETATAHRNRLMGANVDVFVRFDLASEVGALQSVNELFGILLHHSRLDTREITQLRTALLEIGSNAIEWGNKNDASKLVRVRTLVGPTKVEIHVEDEGEGFNPANLPHAADGGEDPTRHFSVRAMLGLREGGFGILIARGLVDECRYNEAGNAVSLIKYVRN